MMNIILRVLIVVVITLNVAINVTIAQNIVPLNCGDIVQVETTPENPYITYEIQARAGTTLSGSIEPIGSTLNVVGVFQDAAGNNLFIANENGVGQADVFSDFTISSSETYLYVGGSTSNSNDFINSLNTFFIARSAYGAFVVSLGCVLPNGTVIEPGGMASDPIQVHISTGSGFLFPELPEDGIELPLIQGQPQTIPVGSDIVLYTYEVANTDQSATLSIARVSGDISLGITVMNRDTSEIIFLGGMPSSNNLSVELTFPTDGTYAIGLFRLDTVERSGTSGAVQLMLE